jgi:hypothetical protein
MSGMTAGVESRPIRERMAAAMASRQIQRRRVGDSSGVGLFTSGTFPVVRLEEALAQAD